MAKGKSPSSEYVEQLQKRNLGILQTIECL